MAKRVRELEVFQGGDGLWYWRLIERNGKVVAVGGEGYSQASNARRSGRTLFPDVVVKNA